MQQSTLDKLVPIAVSTLADSSSAPDSQESPTLNDGHAFPVCGLSFALVDCATRRVELVESRAIRSKSQFVDALRALEAVVNEHRTSNNTQCQLAAYGARHVRQVLHPAIAQHKLRAELTHFDALNSYVDLQKEVSRARNSHKKQSPSSKQTATADTNSKTSNSSSSAKDLAAPPSNQLTDGKSFFGEFCDESAAFCHETSAAQEPLESSLIDALFEFDDTRRKFAEASASSPQTTDFGSLARVARLASLSLRMLGERGKLLRQQTRVELVKHCTQFGLSCNGLDDLTISPPVEESCASAELQQASRRASSCVVRARGLPWQAAEQDVVDFFAGLNVVAGGVALCLSPAGRRNGEALVKFEDDEQRALAQQRHKHYMGARYIEVYAASNAEFSQVASGFNQKAAAFLSRGAQVIIRMRGLPFTCSARQVVDFFANHSQSHAQLQSSVPAPQVDIRCHVFNEENGVLFVKNADDKPTGDAFVLFASDSEAQKALAKHKHIIGARYIELFRSSTSEMQQVLNLSSASSATTSTSLSAAAATLAAASQKSYQPSNTDKHYIYTSAQLHTATNNRRQQNQTKQQLIDSQAAHISVAASQLASASFTYAQAAMQLKATAAVQQQQVSPNKQVYAKQQVSSTTSSKPQNGKVSAKAAITATTVKSEDASVKHVSSAVEWCASESSSAFDSASLEGDESSVASSASSDSVCLTARTVNSEAAANKPATQAIAADSKTSPLSAEPSASSSSATSSSPASSPNHKSLANNTMNRNSSSFAAATNSRYNSVQQRVASNANSTHQSSSTGVSSATSNSKQQADFSSSKQNSHNSDHSHHNHNRHYQVYGAQQQPHPHHYNPHAGHHSQLAAAYAGHQPAPTAAFVYGLPAHFYAPPPASQAHQHDPQETAAAAAAAGLYQPYFANYALPTHPIYATMPATTVAPSVQQQSCAQQATSSASPQPSSSSKAGQATATPSPTAAVAADSTNSANNSPTSANRENIAHDDQQQPVSFYMPQPAATSVPQSSTSQQTNSLSQSQQSQQDMMRAMQQQQQHLMQPTYFYYWPPPHMPIDYRFAATAAAMPTQKTNCA